MKTIVRAKMPLSFWEEKSASTFALPQADERKLMRLLRLSNKVSLTSGRYIFIGTPGNPAPVPTVVKYLKKTYKNVPCETVVTANRRCLYVNCSTWNNFYLLFAKFKKIIAFAKKIWYN